MDRTIRATASGLLAAALLIFGMPLWAAAADESAQGASEESVQQEVDKQLAEKRREMVAEAQSALLETSKALKALDEGKRKEALEALARATGKLELLVARDPELALAPVDVELISYDLYATPKAIRKARDEAEEFLEDGKVQEARALLSGLASELIIRVTNLPLATYPDAIKAISPLIDEGKIEEAKVALRAALNTLVVTEDVIPLPVLRARAMLDAAEDLLEKEGASDVDKEAVGILVDGAREQIEMAELLGYGSKRDHKAFRKQIDELASKIEDEKETKGIFAKLRKRLDDIESSFFD